MRKVLVIIAVMFLSYGVAADHAPFEQPMIGGDTAVLDSLMLINYAAYKGQTVQELLNALPKNQLESKLRSGSRASIIGHMYVSYPDGSLVKIYVSNFQFMNPKDYNMVWDINKFKQEKIDWALFIHKTSCVKNCSEDYL